jgi:hypothetical protein
MQGRWLDWPDVPWRFAGGANTSPAKPARDWKPLARIEPTIVLFEGRTEPEAVPAICGSDGRVGVSVPLGNDRCFW